MGFWGFSPRKTILVISTLFPPRLPWAMHFSVLIFRWAWAATEVHQLGVCSRRMEAPTGAARNMETKEERITSSGDGCPCVCADEFRLGMLA
jgi:hypothetical protein